MTVTDQTPDYFTLSEIVERYRSTEQTVRYWRHIGYGPQGVRVGARVLYPRSEVERFDRELLASEPPKPVRPRLAGSGARSAD